MSKKNVESARRFLWDQDEDITPSAGSGILPSTTTTVPRSRTVPSGGLTSSATTSSAGSGSSARPFSTRDYSVDQSVNLMAMGDQPSSLGGGGGGGGGVGLGGSTSLSHGGRPSIRDSVAGLFRGGTDLSGMTTATSSSAAGTPRFDEYGDASPSTEAEEYISDKHRRRITPLTANICGFWNQLLDRCAVTCGRLSGRSIAWLICIALCLVLLIGGIVLGLDEKQISRAGEIQDRIVSSGTSDAGSVTKNGTPQQLAYSWIVKTDPAQLSANDEALLDRYSLAVLYYAMGGPRWDHKDNWLTANGICSWYGVQCIPSTSSTNNNGPPSNNGTSAAVPTNNNNPVTAILLPNNFVQGALPRELWTGFSTLLYLDLSQNEVSGGLSSEMGTMKLIRSIVLQKNSLVGTIPTELGLLTTLHDFQVGSNRFTGSLPTEINLLQELRTLLVDHNLLTGTIPVIAGLGKLSNLYLDDNTFKGTMPQSLDKFPNMGTYARRRVCTLHGPFHFYACVCVLRCIFLLLLFTSRTMVDCCAYLF